MPAADTNIIVRILVRDDPEQTATADAFVATGAWVPVIAVVEAFWVMERLYRRRAAQLADSLEMLLNHETLILQDSDAVAAALVLFRARPSLGLADCLILEVARKAGQLPLYTFDRALSKLEDVRKL